MTERMKQVSLRKFRTEIADIREPTEVSRRDGDGSIQILGYWTPYIIREVAPSFENVGGKPVLRGDLTAAFLDIPVEDGAFPVGEDSEFDRHPRTAGIIKTPAEAAVAVRVDPVRAVPKPSAKRK